MGIVIQKLRAIFNIMRHLWVCRKVITNPIRCARLFMERTPDSYTTGLRFGTLRFSARKEDMSAVREVLVGGGYDFLLPYLNSIPQTPLVLDCGANIGSFALLVLKERPDARIISVEAAADTYAILVENQSKNTGAWKCVHAALWSFDGQLSLQRSAVSVMHSVREVGAETSERVPARTLKSIMDEHGLDRVDILKMDIEGAEAAVIPAVADDLRTDVMIVELHKNVSDPTECCKILAKKFPYAYVDNRQQLGREFPNVVYYLSKWDIPAPGLVAVDMLDHLNTVYIPEHWQTL